MELSNTLKWDMSGDDELVWKYPSEEILIGSQLIVGEGQEAVFIKGGELLDVFGSGTHTLISANIPLLNKLINLPFSNNTPFAAEVWFINKLTKMDIKWGTKSPIQIMDETLGIPVSIRSFGRWGYKIENPGRLIKRLVGTQSTITANVIRETLYGFIAQALNGAIFEQVNKKNLSILNLAGHLDTIASSVSKNLEDSMQGIGLEIINFNIESINIPDEELSSIREIYRKTLEAREFSKTHLTSAYGQLKSFDVMDKAASNDSQNSAGILMGAGMGMGVGAPMGNKLGYSVTSGDSESPTDRLKAAKSMLDDGLITEDQFNTIREKIIEGL